jgi:hypothetical protein
MKEITRRLVILLVALVLSSSISFFMLPRLISDKTLIGVIAVLIGMASSGVAALLASWLELKER